MRSSRAPVVPEASGAFGLRHVDPRHGLAPGPVHLRILADLGRLHNLSHRLDPRALVLRHAGRTHQVSRRGRSRVCDSLSRRKAEHNSQSSADREAIANPFAFCKARRDATTVEVPTTFADSSSVSASGTIAKFCRSTCLLRAQPDQDCHLTNSAAHPAIQPHAFCARRLSARDGAGIRANPQSHASPHRNWRSPFAALFAISDPFALRLASSPFFPSYSRGLPGADASAYPADARGPHPYRLCWHVLVKDNIELSWSRSAHQTG